MGDGALRRERSELEGYGGRSCACRRQLPHHDTSQQYDVQTGPYIMTKVCKWKGKGGVVGGGDDEERKEKEMGEGSRVQ